MSDFPTHEWTEQQTAGDVLQEKDHKPVFVWAKDQGGWYGAARHEMECSCGKKVYTYGYLTTKGRITKSQLRAFNTHIHEVRGKYALSIGQPILVGRVHKKRVTHEVWVFHKSHELPDGLRDMYGVWTAALKYRDGWKHITWRVSTREAAVLKAANYLEDQGEVYNVEMLYEGDVGVEAPVATIVSAATKLVNDAKTVKKNPVAIKNHITLIDEGIKQIDILKEVKGQLEDELLGLMDLGL